MVRKVLLSWGPGKFDAEVFMDGKAFQPDGRSAAALIPPAFDLVGVNLHNWTGWGSVTYWNAFVANLEMHGQGRFFDSRLNNAARFPVAAASGFGNVTPVPRKTGSPPSSRRCTRINWPSRRPTPPSTALNFAAQRGKTLFNGKAQCARCHVPPLFTEPGWNAHPHADIFEKHGMESVGYWVPDDSTASQNTLIYILAHASREAAEKNWSAFREDPEWQTVGAESEAAGKIVEKIDSIFMAPTDFSALK